MPETPNATKPPRPPVFYTVPAGTRPRKCRGANCGKLIYFVTNARGGLSPIDCDVEGGRRPSDTNDPAQTDAFAGTAAVHDGMGVSHFLTCVDAEDFH